MPPFFLLLKVRTRRRNVLLPLPLFIIYLILLPLFLILLPLILITLCIVSAAAGVNYFRIFPIIAEMLSSLRDVHIDVKSQRESCYIRFF